MSQKYARTPEQTPIGQMAQVHKDPGHRSHPAKGSREIDQLAAPGVGVGKTEQDLIRQPAQRLEDGDGLPRSIERYRDRMISNQYCRAIKRDPKLLFYLAPRQKRLAPQMVQRRRARPVHAPAFLAHRQHSQPRILGGREVDMAHLSQGVADRVIDGPLADLASLDVRDWDPQRQSDRARSKQLVA